ncbi:MAG TPA: Gfo/Idh/MocA family oxidoreductase [Candidatus Krumholzibacteriaceae bacterium]|nr:Gfo/Idh/MocA family oxidoreductase [Candidatus Krumholzibacteriaceae bacterium]
MSLSNSGLKAGVIGTGNLGKNHVRIYSGCDDIDSVYLYDIDRENARKISEKFNAELSPSLSELLKECDILSVCTPATTHFDIVCQALDSGVDVLVEKPITSDWRDGAKLVDKAKEKNRILQVGHIERFNGVFESILPLIRNPMFIECHRLGTFTPRGTDVSVIVDLMIHDIDIILAILGYDQLVETRSSGAGVITESADIVNARLEFKGGCVANITASRISPEPFRKIRFFQENLYLSADFRKKKVKAFRKADRIDFNTVSEDPTSFIDPLRVEVDMEEPLKKEIYSFISAVKNSTDVVVTGEQAVKALMVAEKIIEGIKTN